MVAIRLSIEADLCGPISVGTVSVVRALMTHAGLPLEEALALVDRCVFDAQCVEVPVATPAAAQALLAALERTPAAARIHATLTP
jgi:hypothetical protein